jgi:TRAP-type C4-dicarboxylate transport system permease small subunit
MFDRGIHVLCMATFAITAWFAWELIELQLPFRTPGSGLPNAAFTAPLLLGLVGLIVVLLNKLVANEPAAAHGIGGPAQ